MNTTVKLLLVFCSLMLSVFSYASTNTPFIPTDAPPNIMLFPASINENAAINIIHGTLSNISPNAGNSFTNSLVASSGSSDKTRFSILENSLRSVVTFQCRTTTVYETTVTTSSGLVIGTKTTKVSSALISLIQNTVCNYKVKS